MKNSLLLLLSLLCLIVGATSPVQVKAQDQLGLSQEAGTSYRQADKKLNIVYGKVLKKYAQNHAFLALLKKAEIAWIQYRDRHTDAVFPEAKRDPDTYGSALDMCLSLIPAALTEERAGDLNDLLNGTVPKKTDAASQFPKAELALNKMFNAAVKGPHPDEPSFAAKMKLAQQSWLAFRNADAEAFASLASPADQDIVRSSRLLKLDQLRTKVLDQWVKGIPEGDVCTGSRKIAD